MAHVTEVIGVYSELAAELALMANGYVVSRTRTAEAFDLKAVDPVNGEEYKFQVKTIRKRADRNGELVVYATNGRGNTYSKSDVDYFIGVLAEEGEVPRVFMFENREIREYWSSEARASKRWVELSIALNRDIYVTKDTEAV
ncbi:hypothetical protein [Peribacillus huizhouensis]|uniref:PD(D/E)XK endonuclease domain-containing protein n=1 Tax=Peribacillus huizhouensis TaxID=1501239 RepID=A0ABR6CRA5_9BACI|nr:hypothetical protein [Peribacillus huizhouensis]MBA9027563.1 hypothetical protein [Peribacillus huizhouensis]